MSNNKALIRIKIIHTLIWLFFNVVIFYMLFAVLTNRIDYRLWICYGIIFLEGLVLLIFRMFCPLTLWARKYSTSERSNFDIYLPEWLARYNKVIYTAIVFVITLILIARYFRFF